jgi:IclR family transcriptional regulator, mhp operon transcriptional activator
MAHLSTGERAAERSRPTDADGDKVSFKPIRATLRSLDALRVLNMQNGATVTEVSRATGLARTTAFRVLETLVAGGYAVRDSADDRYRPTMLVRALADGYADESWVRDIAKPQLETLTAKIKWPLSLATPSGTGMLIRCNTDRDSPLTLYKYTPGITVPLATSAAGLAYLAWCETTHRDALIDILARAPKGAETGVRSRELLVRQLEEVRRKGYAVHEVGATNQSTIAVPVGASEGRLLGAITLRWIASALTEAQIIDSYLGQLREMASAIAQEAIAKDAPREQVVAPSNGRWMSAGRLT